MAMRTPLSLFVGISILPRMRRPASFLDALRKAGRPFIAPPLHGSASNQFALQLAGVVELFELLQSGPKPPLEAGTLSIANGPALCSPLNGVGLVGSK